MISFAILLSNLNRVLIDLDRVCHRDRSLPDDIWTNSLGEPAPSPY
ncbi:hypothetical protein [Nostoc sp.]